MRIYERSLILALSLFMILGMGCYEGGGSPPYPQPSRLLLSSPKNLPIFSVNESAQFNAKVLSPSGYVIDNQAATWTTTIGSITQSGLFVAPITPGTGAVRVSLKSDPGVIYHLDINVIATPRVLAFTATPSAISLGTTSTLKVEFTDGVGNVDPGFGPVASGQGYPVSPASTTTYTLKVKNAAGTEVASQVTVTVGP